MEKTMTYENMSPEQRGKFYDSQIGGKIDEARFKDLETISVLLGRNQLESKDYLYGRKGNSAANAGYKEFMHSDYARELSKNMYNQQMKENKELGIPDKPVITDYQKIREATISGMDIFENAGVKKLEKLVQEKIPNAKIENNAFSKKLSSFKGKMRKEFVEGKGNYKPNQEEQKLLQMEQGYRGMLLEAFQDASAKELMDKHYFGKTLSDFNKFYGQFEEKKEKPEAKEKPIEPEEKDK